jgi:hypothetical protein
MMMIRTSRFLVLAMVVVVLVVVEVSLLASEAKQVRVIPELVSNQLEEHGGLRKDRFRKRLCLAVGKMVCERVNALSRFVTYISFSR